MKLDGLEIVELKNDAPQADVRRTPARVKTRERWTPSASAWMATAAVLVAGCCTIGTPGPAGIAAGVATIGAGILLAVWALIVNRKDRC